MRSGRARHESVRTRGREPARAGAGRSELSLAARRSIAAAEAAVEPASRLAAPSSPGHQLAAVRVARPPRPVATEGEVLSCDQTTTAPAGGGSSASASGGGGTATCAHPVGWTHTGASDSGANAIRIPITWGSSTGSLADLSSCTVREVVRYDPIPDPPFRWKPPNPTILTVPGSAGAGQDTHSYPPGLSNGIATPRVAGTMTAHQAYEYQCTGTGCSGTWTGFPGETYDITREVFARFIYTDPWRYRITKRGTGTGNTFSYSREVPIP